LQEECLNSLPFLQGNQADTEREFHSFSCNESIRDNRTIRTDEKARIATENMLILWNEETCVPFDQMQGITWESKKGYIQLQ
jgi:hypothetical protein